MRGKAGKLSVSASREWELQKAGMGQGMKMEEKWEKEGKKEESAWEWKREKEVRKER
jgi:hypothetical protein